MIYAAFARMRDDPQRVAEVWLNGLMLVGGVVLPVLVLLIALAPDLIPLAFGPQWIPAVSVVQILAVFFMSRALQMWNTSVMDAAGKPHVGMVLNALVLIALPPSIWLGSTFGLTGVAVAYSLAALAFGEIPSFVLTTRELGVKPLRVLGRLREIALSAAAAGVAAMLVRRALEAGMGVEPRLAVSVAVGALVYVSTLLLIAPGIARQLRAMVRGLGPALRPS